jgi:cytochrome d ubiquinol oxidase subunit I
MLASTLEAARSQMAFTLGFHIILASLGVALPAMMLIANYRGLRRDDPDALRLAQRWSKAVAVTFAVGAVTGTVLSFEFGLLWPAFTGRFGEVFGVLFAIEGSSSSSRRSSSRSTSSAGSTFAVDPLLVGSAGRDRGSRRRVLGRGRELVDEPASGILAATGRRHLGRRVEGDLQPAVPYEVPHMILAAYLVPGSWLASIYAVGMLAAGANPHPSPRTPDPVDGCLYRHADPVRGRRHPPRVRSRRPGRSSSPRWNACRRRPPT